MATYSDGTSGSVTYASYSPSVWGETAGTQTVTFSFADTDVICEVEATIEESVVLSGLSITGTPAAQYVGQAPDLTGLTFKAVYSDTSEEPVDVADIAVSPATWAEAGSATLTCSYTEDETTVSDTVSVTVSVDSIVSITATGLNSALQIKGSAPVLTGVTLTGTKASGTTVNVALDDSDLTITPATWDASGNPDNLGSQTLTFTLDVDGTDVIDEVSTAVHWADSQTLDISSAGYIYHDFSEALRGVVADGAYINGMNPVFDPSFGHSYVEGDYIVASFTKDAYDNDTAVDYTTFGGWLTLYGIKLSSSGTVNTPGFVPGWGLGGPNAADAADSYISISVDGTSTMTAGQSSQCYTVVGQLTRSITAPGSIKKSDINTNVTGGAVFLDTLYKPE